MPKPKPEDKYNLDEKKLRSLSLEKQKEFLMAANNSIFFEDESYTISDVMQDIYKLN
jgi:hypothetical protein